MEITGNLGLLDAHYDNGTFTDVQTIAGIPGCGGGEPIGTYNCTVDRSDEKLPQVPKITYSIGLTQTVPMSLGELRRSEEHTSELQSLMRISYAVFCLKTNKYNSMLTY